MKQTRGMEKKILEDMRFACAISRAEDDDEDEV